MDNLPTHAFLICGEFFGLIGGELLELERVCEEHYEEVDPIDITDFN